MIKLENGYKHFYTKKMKTVALNNISLEVNEGEFLAITGKSGSGKSTLLNALGLFSSIDQGSIELNGINVSRMSKMEKLKCMITDLEPNHLSS